ncbi:hypothetical protein AAY473_018297 [Plecturocebus cupreus]
MLFFHCGAGAGRMVAIPRRRQERPSLALITTTPHTHRLLCGYKVSFTAELFCSSPLPFHREGSRASGRPRLPVRANGTAGAGADLYLFRVLQVHVQEKAELAERSRRVWEQGRGQVTNVAVPESAGSGRRLPASRPGHAPFRDPPLRCGDPQHLIPAKHNPGAPSALPPHSRRRHAREGGSSYSSARSLAAPGLARVERKDGARRTPPERHRRPPAAAAWKGSLQPPEQRVGLQPPAPPPVPSLRAETPLWSRREPGKSSLRLCAPAPPPLPSPRP